MFLKAVNGYDSFFQNATYKLDYEASDPGAATLPADGHLRIWTEEANVVRNSDDVLNGGHYIAPNSVYTAAQLNMDDYGDASLCLEGIIPGESTVDFYVDPDGPSGPIGWILLDTVKITVINVDLNAAHSTDSTEASPGTPVMLNDDWDSGLRYGAGAPSGKRELEPIWDLDYTDGAIPAENDLMAVDWTLDVSSTLALLDDTAILKIASGDDKIRIWDNPRKGTTANQIVIPAGGQTISASTFSPTIYIEGIALGRAELVIEYAVGTSVFSDILTIDVVTLQESQAGTRKIINDYNSDIMFEVVDSSGIVSDYECKWDFNGDGARNTGAWESGTNSRETLKYWSGASMTGAVHLPRSAATRRQTYNVSVELTGGLVLEKEIRVALDAYYGTALPAQSTAGLHTLFTWSNTSPVAFTALPPGDPHLGANRISYDAGMAPTTEAEAHTNGAAGAAATIEYVTVGPAVWSSNYTEEILQAIVAHEIIHLNQFAETRYNAGSLWRQLSLQYSGLYPGLVSFMETEAYASYFIGNATLDWRWLESTGKLLQFCSNYTNASGEIGGFSSSLQSQARSFLQGFYLDIGAVFVEMYRYDSSGNPVYDHGIRAPQ